MNEYLWAALYMLIAVIGAIVHWAKKRYIDKTTKLCIRRYVLGKPRATFNAVAAIVGATVPLAIAHGSGGDLGLADLYAALGAGYAADSGLNQATDTITYEEPQCSLQQEKI